MVLKCLFWSTFRVKNVHIEVGKDQTITKTNYGFLNSPKKWTKLVILSKEETQDSEFCSFLGRIEDTINCFRDLLTFSCYAVLIQILLWHFQLHLNSIDSFYTMGKIIFKERSDFHKFWRDIKEMLKKEKKNVFELRNISWK